MRMRTVRARCLKSNQIFNYDSNSRLAYLFCDNQCPLIMMNTVLLLLFVVPSCCITVQFSLPGRPLSTTPDLQVDSQGRAYVAANNQLFKLNRDLVVQQTINLSSSAVGISLSSSGEWLVVCIRNSCTVYNTSDLNNVISMTEIEPGIRDQWHVAVFTAGDTYYVGNVILYSTNVSRGYIILRQYDFRSGYNLRYKTFYTNQMSFRRTFFGGFSSGEYSYFVVADRSAPTSFRIMRVCHVTNCTGGCSFGTLHEEDFSCGGEVFSGDWICGISVMENFAGSSGINVVFTRCCSSVAANDVMCAIKLADIDRTMERRSNECLAGNGSIQPAWSSNEVACSPRNAHQVTMIISYVYSTYMYII